MRGVARQAYAEDGVADGALSIKGTDILLPLTRVRGRASGTLPGTYNVAFAFTK
jgi:hypothetical protein